MKILLSTSEGFPKDKKAINKKRFSNKPIYFLFNGDDAPIKAVRAIMQKYGITKEEL